MRIRRKFLQLTSETIPHGFEKQKMKKFLPKGIKEDKWGNFYLTIGEDFTTMFTCHLDTASGIQKRVVHVQDDKYIKTDGNTILGADDKAGMVVLLYMIEKKVPGLYYFFVGEEVGCIGSSKLASSFDWLNITKVISFDRRGTNSVITEQFCGKCCSDEFAIALASKLNATGFGLELSPDDTGVLTDSAQFVDLVNECTNISVGYYYEHTTKEIQDIDYLTRLCQACVKINWELLPIFREPGDDGYDIEDEDDFDDDEVVGEFNQCYFTNVNINGITKKMFISVNQIKKETNLIKDLLTKQGYNTKLVIWDGRDCYYEENGSYNFIGTRQDLILFISDLEYIPQSELKEHINTNDKSYNF
jgi:hypothetical protein